MNIQQTTRKLRTLDFDIENKPLNYGGGDFTFSEVTAIAASWVGSKEVKVWLLSEVSSEEMLIGFKELYDQADVVTGHYIRNHDLPILAGAYVEFGLEGLGPKLTSDTKNDLIGFRGISKSQENLAAVLGLPQPKFQMSQYQWRQANRFTSEGIALTKKRVAYDVKQHKALRQELIKRNMLGPMKMWKGRPDGCTEE